MTPSVSIIIPCYNAERYIGETLESALSQTECDVEIIVVDDGSTDGSRRVIEAFQPRVHLETGPNQGVSAARERGSSHANGEFILYLDADDLLAPNTLAEQARLLQSTDVDVVYGGWRRLELRDGRWTPTSEVLRRVTDVHPDPEIAFFTEMWAPTGAYLWRRSFLEERHPGWHPNLPVIQDARFAWDAAHAGAKFLYRDSICVLYRTNQSNSVSTRNRRAFLKDCCVNALEIETIWREEGPLTSARAKALISVWGNFTRNAYPVDQDLFRDCWRQLRTLDPSYIPSGGKGFRALAGLVGYPLAEGITHFRRRLLRKPSV